MTLNGTEWLHFLIELRVKTIKNVEVGVSHYMQTL